jgi:hypothetical protein
MYLLTTYTQELWTTSTYNAIADLHTLQITRSHAKTSQSAFTSRFLATDLNNEYSSACDHAVARWLTHHNWTRFDYSAISSRPPSQNSTELIAPTVLVITSRYGPHRKHCSSNVALVSVAVGTCLPSCCPETGCVTPFIKNPLPSNERCFATVAQ